MKYVLAKGFIAVDGCSLTVRYFLNPAMSALKTQHLYYLVLVTILSTSALSCWSACHKYDVHAVKLCC